MDTKSSPLRGNQVQKPSSQHVLSHSRSGLRLSKHHRDRAVSDAKEKELPLVERTNAMSVQDFVSRYIDPSQLQLNIATKLEDDSSTTTTTTAPIQIYSASTIPSLDFEGCFSLIETTSAENYKASSMGWSPSKKRKEMRLPDMRFMVLRGPPQASPIPQRNSSNNNNNKRTTRNSSGTSTPGESEVSSTSESGPETAPTAAATTTTTSPHSEVLGFLSFMTTYEDGKKVLYCYEIHIHPSLQGQGIGRHLMSLFEETGRRIGLEKGMLTVFRANSPAVGFYSRLGYTVDEYSPGPRKLRNGTVKEPDYLILSKAF
ncbi:GNAT family acetyltransferase Nat4, putative [Talaromyces stipitatus ATCC 10500]|uniref:N-alpha-acetyltransferase 40 n=1 Tax=Talaromyces stipitatus (strain ATCC 10500 / CBS 375.48 / QM 6759 / NRRL 1006) TaxID=441959 RepID=B8MB66_TALSN|nr:GNAT family acetyltransferase Nat4, putative [Talaromyces stipitatus ATCC 10500]EED18855.1 GNAT family acetyltransferase Nat4, putative [Talaromyces stipitatus ATCC 10500]